MKGKKAVWLGGIVAALVTVGFGTYLAGGSRFERTFPGPADQPMVKDNVTGLTWQGCPAGLSGSDCLTGTISLKTWADATGYCTGLAWGGQSTGWRLPYVKELSSLVDRRKYLPAIDTTAFPNTPSNSFWSLSSDASYTSYAWTVTFNTGDVNSDSKTSHNDVRCVRG